MEDILQLLGHLTPGELLVDPRSAPSDLYLGLLGFFGLLAIVGLIASLRAAQLARGNRVHRRMLDLYGQWAAWLGLAGIVIVGLRYANTTLLSKRLWTVLDLVAIALVAAHLVWYRVRRYPSEIAIYREDERKRRYLPSVRRRRR